MVFKLGNVGLKYCPLCTLKMVKHGQFHIFQPKNNTHLQWTLAWKIKKYKDPYE